MMSIGKKLLSTLLAVMLLLNITLVSANAAETDGVGSQFPDMPDNWSTQALKNAVENGLLQGSDGMLLPNGKLTRAQMATVIVRAFGASVMGDISEYSDVKSDNWFYEYIAKAYQMGVMIGTNDKMNPNAPITRQEAFVIIARALKLQPADTINKTFTDVNDLADWAKGLVYSVVNAGYVQGSNGYLKPKATITRAEFAQVMDNILKQYIKTAGTVTQVATTGNVMINVPGVTLQNLTVNGDLVIGDGVGDGDVILDSVKITGRLVIRGGGENSIIIKGNSDVATVVVARIDGKVSVKIQGNADVDVVYVVDGSDDVIVEGTVGDIQVIAPNVVVTATAAKITNVDVIGKDSVVILASGSTVGSINVLEGADNVTIQVAGTVTDINTKAANTVVNGSGTVTGVKVLTGASGASITTPRTVITVEQGVTGVTAAGGVAVPAGGTATNNAAGTSATISTPSTPGGGGPTTPVTPPTAPTASNVSISGAAQVGETLTGNYTYSDVNGDSEGTSIYKWYANTGTDGAYEEIAGATTKTFVIPESLQGKMIKFEVTPVSATGTPSTGTPVMSAATSEVVAPSDLSNLSVTNITTTTAKLNFTSSQVGTYYYLVLSANTTAPDEAVVYAQGTAAAKGTGSAAAGTEAHADISGLEAGKAYKVYLVVEASGFSDVAAVGFTTSPAVITDYAILGVTAPVPGATPVTTITPNEQFTGTVTWSPAHSTFKAGFVYTATITLAAKAGYTFNGVSANSFTVLGSTANNPANVGIVTASFPATKITTAAQFIAALADNDVSVITLGGNITGNVLGARDGAGTLTLNFGTNVLDGDLNITADNVTAITLNGTAVPAVTGDLTISASSATVTNYINVGGDITVNGVSADTWIEYADGNSVYIDDNNGATIQIHGNPDDVVIQTGAAGINITAVNPVGITVEPGAVVNNIIVGANAVGTTIENNGTLGGVTANANTNIINKTDSEITVIADESVTVGASGSYPEKVTGVITVLDISSVLRVSTTLQIGAVTSANITEVTLGAGETYKVVSADPAVVSVNAITGLALTANKPGKAAITVQVLNASGEVIKQGTIFVTVKPEELSAASVVITAPVLGQTPKTLTEVQSATNAANYDVTGLVWNGTWTPAGKFKAGEEYTATVTLTSKNAKAFSTTAFTPTVNGAVSVGTTTALGAQVGNSIIFTVTFPATAAPSVTSIKITSQPTKLNYVYNEALDLSGLLITEIYNDGTTVLVPFTNGTAAGYTASPANGMALATDKSYTPVTITRDASALSVTTAKLTVMNLTQAAPTGLGAVAATPNVADGKITGTTTLMEYKAAAAKTYTPVTGSTINDLAPGDYHVRFKAKTGYDPSPTVIVHVPGLVSISLNTGDVKTIYKVGESLSIAGLIVTGTYTDGSTKALTITAANVTGFNSAAVTLSQTLTVRVAAASGIKTATYTVQINRADGLVLPASVTADNITNTMSGLTSAMEFSTNGENWTAYNAATPNLPDLTGDLTLYVRYAESATHTAGPIKVFKFSTATLQSIEITTPATKSVYKVGEPLDITGLVVTGTYDADPAEKTEVVKESNITGFNSSAVAATQTLTITIEGKIATYDISIVKADGPAVVGVHADDTNNSVHGMTTDMEYKLDDDDYVDYVAGTFNAIDFSGEHTLLVRMRATDIAEAGPVKTFTFTTNTFTLKYIAGVGGSITGTLTQTVNSGASGTAVTAIAATGYTFKIWSDGITTATRTDTNVTANITVTAVFTINQYTVSFRDYDGVELKAQTVNFGTSATAPADPTRAADAQYEYTFSTWDNDFTNVTSDLIVTATYTSALRSYVVTFKNDDGTTLGSQSVLYGSAAIAPEVTKPADATYTYEFSGWDVPFDYITGNLTVTAQYTAKAIITGFDPIAAIDAGIEGHALGLTDVVNMLPKTVTANSGAATVTVISWVDTDTYNPGVRGSYTFTATLGTIPAGFSNPNNRTVTIEVVVKPPAYDASDIDEIIRAGIVESNAEIDENYAVIDDLAIVGTCKSITVNINNCTVSVSAVYTDIVQIIVDALKDNLDIVASIETGSTELVLSEDIDITDIRDFVLGSGLLGANGDPISESAMIGELIGQSLTFTITDTNDNEHIYTMIFRANIDEVILGVILAGAIEDINDNIDGYAVMTDLDEDETTVIISNGYVKVSEVYQDIFNTLIVALQANKCLVATIEADTGILDLNDTITAQNIIDFVKASGLEGTGSDDELMGSDDISVLYGQSILVTVTDKNLVSYDYTVTFIQDPIDAIIEAGIVESNATIAGYGLLGNLTGDNKITVYITDGSVNISFVYTDIVSILVAALQNNTNIVKAVKTGENTLTLSGTITADDIKNFMKASGLHGTGSSTLEGSDTIGDLVGQSLGVTVIDTNDLQYVYTLNFADN